MCRPSTSFWITGSYYILSHLSFFQFILFPLPEILCFFFLLKFHFVYEVFLDSHSQNFFLISVLPSSMYLPCFKALTTFSFIVLHVQVYLYCCVVQSQKMSFMFRTFPFSLAEPGPLSTLYIHYRYSRTGLLNEWNFKSRSGKWKLIPWAVGSPWRRRSGKVMWSELPLRF